MLLNWGRWNYFFGYSLYNVQRAPPDNTVSDHTLVTLKVFYIPKACCPIDKYYHFDVVQNTQQELVKILMRH